MTDEELADAMIARLNDIVITDPEALAALIEVRVPCAQTMVDHPRAQVSVDEAGSATVGLLGVLNGIAGTVASGPNEGWGLIIAVVEAGALVEFRRTLDTDRATE